MKDPVLHLPTLKDKRDFLALAYDHGLTWCGSSRASALKQYDETYEKNSIWTHVSMGNPYGRNQVWFRSGIDPDSVVVNSPMQFIRYAKILSKS